MSTPEIPAISDGSLLFPDPAIAKSHREMKRITEDGLAPGDTPLECFMADYDEADGAVPRVPCWDES